MLSRIVADMIVLVHAAFVCFAVFGGLFALRWPRIAWLHLPVLFWALWIECSGWICPLTPLENMFRRFAGEAGYSEGFINHYLLPVLYPPGLSRSGQIVLGIMLLAVNGGIYAWLLRQRVLEKKG